MNEPLFIISVAARLVEMHPQTLRKYEREGLVAPSRTHGNLRLYSDEDIARLHQVKFLVEQCGLNLAGVQLALQLSRQLQDIQSQLLKLSDEASRTGQGIPAGSLGDVVAGVTAALAAIGAPGERTTSRDHDGAASTAREIPVRRRS